MQLCLARKEGPGTGGPRNKRKGSPSDAGPGRLLRRTEGLEAFPARAEGCSGR